VQNWTGVQVGQEFCDALRNRPSTQSEQVELEALVQVREDSQPSTAPQVVHTVGSVDDRQKPLSHELHDELVAVVQVSVPLQCPTLVHVLHCPSMGSR
jgi:hypothetical protein